MKKERKTIINKKIYYSILVTIIIFLLPTSVMAKEKRESGTDFTLKAILPDNQRDKKVTYFDLLVEPEKEQAIKIQVTNTSKKDLKVKVTPTNARTDQNGQIDYSIPIKNDKIDSTLSIPFTSLVKEDMQIVDVKPGKVKEITFSLTPPREPFEGLILGGFVGEIADDGEKNDDVKGITLVNHYQLIKAIMLRSSEKPVEPKLKLNAVKAELVDYRPAVTANIQNTMFGNLTINAQITKKDSSKIVKSIKVNQLEMAPNSNFDFPIMWNDEPLEAGDYLLNLTASREEKEWPFTQEFTVSDIESKQINKEAIDLTKASKPFPWGYFIIIIVVILSLIGSVIWYIGFQNKPKKKLSKSRKKQSTNLKRIKKNKKR